MKQIDKETQEKRNKKYNTWARSHPCNIFLVITILLGSIIGLNDYIATKLSEEVLIYLALLSSINITFFFLIKFTIRDFSKFYPEKILFCDCLKPTTKLLYSNDSTYSEEQKNEIRKKIKSIKNIDLQKFKVKTFRNKKYVKRINEAVSWLLDVCRFDNILFEYNCIYGFWRNLTGALFLYASFIFVLIVVNKWFYSLPFGKDLLWIGIIMTVFTILSTILAYRNALLFAKRLYDVFMNLNKDENNY